jgi:hypothetical protein
MKVLVLGGSGFVGRALLEQLQRAGHEATVPTRRAAQARDLGPLPAVTVVRGDVLGEAGLLERLLPGHDAVINLIAVLQGSEARFEQVHVQWPHRLARACVGAGVSRLIHVSALGVGDQAPSRYLRSKSRGELTLQSVPGLRARARRRASCGQTGCSGCSSATRSAIASESQVAKPSASMSTGTCAVGACWAACSLKREPGPKSKRISFSSNGMPKCVSSTQGRIDHDE